MEADALNACYAPAEAGADYLSALERKQEREP